MGMFDEIVVPKSYLKGLLDKKQEKLLKGNHVFQTKSLDNNLFKYKVYSQRLYRLGPQSAFGGESAHSSFSGHETWRKLNNTGVIVFYDTIKDKEENEWWFEFGFTFNEGKLDKKELISCKIETTKERKDAVDKMWDTEQEIFDEYRKNFKYRLFLWLERRFQKITNWSRKKHSIPLNIRKEAYKKSGRLERDPDSLDQYLDS